MENNLDQPIRPGGPERLRPGGGAAVRVERSGQSPGHYRFPRPTGDTPIIEVPQSERHVPPWVLASVVLHRLGQLLASTARRFVTVEEDRLAPPGAVDRQRYAPTKATSVRILKAPCRLAAASNRRRRISRA